MTKPLKILTEDYFIGNLGSIEATDEIVSCCHINDHELSEGEIGSGQLNYRIRNCKVHFIDIKNINIINQGLEKAIQNVNDMMWKLNLDNQWESAIQYTRYIDKGHFCDWHPDKPLDPNNPKYNRKLTIVYCLSYKSDYVGGEFQLKVGNNSTYTRKFDYGDFIVFPSEKIHRVKPLKSGNRTTLVGWYS